MGNRWTRLCKTRRTRSHKEHVVEAMVCHPDVSFHGWGDDSPTVDSVSSWLTPEYCSGNSSHSKKAALPKCPPREAAFINGWHTWLPQAWPALWAIPAPQLPGIRTRFRWLCRVLPWSVFLPSFSTVLIPWALPSHILSQGLFPRKSCNIVLQTFPGISKAGPSQEWADRNVMTASLQPGRTQRGHRHCQSEYEGFILPTSTETFF